MAENTLHIFGSFCEQFCTNSEYKIHSPGCLHRVMELLILMGIFGEIAYLAFVALTYSLLCILNLSIMLCCGTGFYVLYLLWTLLPLQPDGLAGK